jgi:hypothetical protein
MLQVLVWAEWNTNSEDNKYKTIPVMLIVMS